jgi:hypothetical protein
MPSSEADLFEGRRCRIVPKTPIHFGNILQIAGASADAKILKWMDHGILIEGNMFVPWSNIVTITPLEQSDATDGI